MATRAKFSAMPLLDIIFSMKILILTKMISPPNNPQPVVFNINITHGNNYVNHGVWSQTPETTGEECAQAGHMLAPMSPLHEAQKTGKSSTTSNNILGFPEGEDTNSCNKEIETISNGTKD